MYLGTHKHTPTTTTTTDWETRAQSLKENKQWYIRGFEGKKRKGEMK